LENEEVLHTIADLVTCFYVPCERCFSAVNATCHCFMFVFSGQISVLLTFIAKKSRTSFTSSFHSTSLFTC
jgi:hypothetical protein